MAITNCRPIVLASRSPANGALHSTSPPMLAASDQPTAASTCLATGAHPSSSPTATTSPVHTTPPITAHRRSCACVPGSPPADSRSPTTVAAADGTISAALTNRYA